MRCDVVRGGAVRCGVVRRDVVRCDAVRCGVARRGSPCLASPSLASPRFGVARRFPACRSQGGERGRDGIYIRMREGCTCSETPTEGWKGRKSWCVGGTEGSRKLRGRERAGRARSTNTQTRSICRYECTHGFSEDDGGCSRKREGWPVWQRGGEGGGRKWVLGRT